jgi:hypothetical protein
MAAIPMTSDSSRGCPSSSEAPRRRPRPKTGTPEQIADTLQDWQNAGVDGFNLIYSVTPGTFVDFIEGVVPVLQQRGLMQTEYAPGPLREKIFGERKLPERHPAAAYRRS